MQSFFTIFSQQLLSIDIYGNKPELKIKKGDNFKTVFGSILTIQTILTSLFALSYFCLLLFDVTNPKLVFSLRNINNPPLIQFDQSNYGFAFGLENVTSYEQFIDESIYRVEAYHMTGTRSSNGTFSWEVEKLGLEKCNINKYPKEFEHIFADLPFQNLYCLKNTTFVLSGTFLNEQYKYIIIKIFECKNSTEPNSTVCQPKSYIDEMLAGTFFSFSHTDITLDPTNYTHPKQVYAGDSYTTVSNKFFKEMHHYLKIVNFATDKGWLVSDVQKDTYFQLDYIKEMTDFRKADNFLSYTVKLSTKWETYHRSYIKIQDVAADCGGLIKLVTVFCLIISYFYNKTKFYEFIGEEMLCEGHTIQKNNFETKKEFEFKSDHNANPHIQIKTNNFFDEHSKTFNEFLNKAEQNNLNNSKMNKSQKSINSKKSKKKSISNGENVSRNIKKAKRLNLKMSFSQSFFYMICCNKNSKKRNYMKLNSIRKKSDEMLDIIKILKNINDIERLKKLVLDEDQLKLFNFPYFMEITIQNKNKNENYSNFSELLDKKSQAQEFSMTYKMVDDKKDEFSMKVLNVINY